ncbi:TIGR01841 family phasin [Massilia sp. IC2-278]|uniref:phasin family protein n=1 Tax=Massilia sp. IC2-278 TaxID=2887200 RepID=UPI001E5B6983|nr:phasin family protein [Massilia sp. IC2-278]MCC2962201.1 TIGR01841 family phasin [Massilia sp. IC2-278]
MYPFSQSVHPAVRTHLDAQTAFLNDVSKSFFQSFQQMCDLNIQLVQTMLEESAIAGQQLITADRQSEVISAAASRAQPASEKLRAYQQHISRLAADAQVELARVTEQHVQNTSRTARALADEVSRTASEETERGLRKQQETVQRFTDPFVRSGYTGNGQAEPRRAGSDAQASQGNGGAHAQAGQGAGIQRGDGNPAGSQAGRGAQGGA